MRTTLHRNLKHTNCNCKLKSEPNFFLSTSTSMAELKHDSDKNVKAPNIFERAKEEIKAVLYTHRMHKESHGTRNDIDKSTPLNDVKAPNVFERAKEEIEAIVQAIHAKKESDNRETRNQSAKEDSKWGKTVKDVKATNLIERGKEEIEGIIHHEKLSDHYHHYRKETHGSSGNIDESTPIDEVRGPNIFERAKEEMEALVQTIHPKKESKNESCNFDSSLKKESGFGASIGRGLEKVCSPEEGGFRASIGKGLEKVCSPWSNKRD